KAAKDYKIKRAAEIEYYSFLYHIIQCIFVASVTSQSLWDHILVSLGSHLSIFGITSQYLWDHIPVSLGSHYSIFGITSQSLM
ncbi:hypothetical protein Bpfe_023461, partial [Biomphalaria pfeifferi]